MDSKHVLVFVKFVGWLEKKKPSDYSNLLNYDQTKILVFLYRLNGFSHLLAAFALLVHSHSACSNCKHKSYCVKPGS